MLAQNGDENIRTFVYHYNPAVVVLHIGNFALEVDSLCEFELQYVLLLSL